ncbi:MAG TPA: tol-pal system-associated acyl-CoA thioesterase [Methylomirabilota bacterium]|nr:tol-pal system-associated acyl-CoA thioesterase [Methylomirabilota bacterium]
MTGASVPSFARAHRFPVRVYWEDTDAGGIVYHAGHVRFFERGRTEMLRAHGISQSATADRSLAEAVLFTVRRLEVDYLKPAALDDLLIVETAVREIGGARLLLDQRLTRGDDVVATAAVTVVMIGGNGRPMRIPMELRALFEAIR